MSHSFETRAIRACPCVFRLAQRAKTCDKIWYLGPLPTGDTAAQPLPISCCYSTALPRTVTGDVIDGPLGQGRPGSPGKRSRQPGDTAALLVPKSQCTGCSSTADDSPVPDRDRRCWGAGGGPGGDSSCCLPDARIPASGRPLAYSNWAQ